MPNSCRFIFTALFSALGYLSGFAQPASADIVHKAWPAWWIAVPDQPATGYGVYLFRKTFTVAEKPARLRVNVSADNRYRLYINEKLVSQGPARSDLEYWNYESVDIAPYLNAGKNQVSAQVWNEAEWRPEAQISNQTGFILQSDATDLNTNGSWKSTRDSSYQPLAVRVPGYYAAGAGVLMDLTKQISGWQTAAFDDSGWKPAKPLSPGLPREVSGAFGTGNGWRLKPSILPQMEETVQRIPVLRSATGIPAPALFPAKQEAVNIPAHTTATLLLDQTYNSNAYPMLKFSGGKAATLSLAYAESLYAGRGDKGNRNQIEGKRMIGRRDSILSGGGPNQLFTTLYFRTYRYIELKITTQNEPLTIDDFYGEFTGYPFTRTASLDLGDTTLSKIFDIGWRTARLCATETYNDCPYYEQLQYIGDGRIQALVSLFNSGDDRLVRNAINLMDASRRSDGMMESRHPSFTPQFIPTFSLWYIGMLHDYWMYGKDTAFLKDKLTGARSTIEFFHRYQQPDGSLANVPHWMFTDWVDAKAWMAGTGPVGADGCSAMIDLQLLWAYQLAADMEKRSGMPAYAKQYAAAAAQLAKTIRAKYWVAGKGLFSDRTEKDLYSQHSNALAILIGLTTPAESKTIAQHLLSDSTLAPASIYFKFYTNLALVKAGLGNDYSQWLGTWRENIALGLTTWAEMADIRHSRSDCHAWGSSPNIEFFRIVLGIDSDAPGFRKVKIEPHPGKLTHLKGSMPHPEGIISAEYTQTGKTWKMSVTLPGKLTGRFVWNGRTIPLHAGVNEFSF